MQPAASPNVISKRINCQVQRVAPQRWGNSIGGDKGVMANKGPCKGFVLQFNLEAQSSVRCILLVSLQSSGGVLCERKHIQRKTATLFH